MPVSRADRRFALARAAGRCEYCRVRGWPLTIDHIIPRQRFKSPDGADGASLPSADGSDNLAAACGLCNRAKSNATTSYDPRTQREQPLFNPRRQRWEDHFRWSADLLRVVGITPCGRATVQRLRLNREEYRQQRALLRAAMRGGGPD